MQTVSCETKINASNNHEYYLVDVIAQILKYMKDQLIESHLKQRGVTLEATDFYWLITVPGIWSNNGKKIMQEAGSKVILVRCICTILPTWSYVCLICDFAFINLATN